MGAVFNRLRVMMDYLLYGHFASFPLSEHGGFVQQVEGNNGWIDLACFTIDLHGDGLGGDNLGRLALTDADTMTTGLE